jgi:Flp pilus assembly protein CpaB
MTRNRSLTILALALVSASVAGFAAVRYTAQRPVPIVDRSTRSVPMVVAARDLPVGHFLSEADLQVVNWPGDALPVGYVSQPSNAVGRGLISEVRMNQPIIEAGLAERGSGGGMPIIFPEGMRAVSVRVDEVVAVAGYVTPRTRVDVMLTFKPTSSTQTHTQIILQNLLVLAAGQTVQHNEQGQPMTVNVVTLMVTPEQGEKLVLAASQGGSSSRSATCSMSRMSRRRASATRASSSSAAGRRRRHRRAARPAPGLPRRRRRTPRSRSSRAACGRSSASSSGPIRTIPREDTCRCATRQWYRTVAA